MNCFAFQLERLVDTLMQTELAPSWTMRSIICSRYEFQFGVRVIKRSTFEAV